MKNVLFLLSSLILFTACPRGTEPEIENSNLTIVLRPEYRGTPIVYYEKFDYFEEAELFYQNISFFVSNLSLKKKNSNDFILVKDIDFFTMEDVCNSNENSLKGLEVKLENIPVGEYQNFSFDLGVAPELNKTIPENYSTTHPLNNPDYYCTPADTYMFIKIEGKYFNEEGVEPIEFTYHTGNDEMTRNVSLDQTFSIFNEDDVNNKLIITFDLEKVFHHNDGTHINIFEHPKTRAVHPEDSVYAAYIMDGLMSSFSITE